MFISLFEGVICLSVGDVCSMDMCVRRVFSITLHVVSMRQGLLLNQDLDWWRMLTTQPNNSSSKYLSKIKESTCPYKVLCMSAYQSLAQTTPVLETASESNGLDKPVVAQTLIAYTTTRPQDQVTRCNTGSLQGLSSERGKTEWAGEN